MRALGFDQLVMRWICLLRQFQMFLQALSLGNVSDRLSNLRIPLGAHFQSLKLSELRGEQIALNAFLHPLCYSSDILIGVIDILRLQKILEVLKDGVVHTEVLAD